MTLIFIGLAYSLLFEWLSFGSLNKIVKILISEPLQLFVLNGLYFIRLKYFLNV